MGKSRYTIDFRFSWLSCADARLLSLESYMMEIPRTELYKFVSL